MYTKLLSIFNSSYLQFNHPVYIEAPSRSVGIPPDIHLLPPSPYLFAFPHYYCKFIHVEGPIKGVFNCYSLHCRGSVIVMSDFKSQAKSEINVRLRIFRLYPFGV